MGLSCLGCLRGGTRPGVAEFDALVAGADFDDAFNENAGRMDVVGIELAGRHQLLDLGHRRSEEHTSELQSHSDLVCRLLLEKKNKKRTSTSRTPTRHGV